MAGVSLNNRKLATSVRTKLLKEVEKILDSGTPEEKKEILFRMCGTLLPRLNEHTGEDGEKLFPAPLLAGKSNGNNNYNGNAEVTCV